MRRLSSIALLITLASSAGNAAEAPDYSGADLYRIFCASCHGEDAMRRERSAALISKLVAYLRSIQQ